MRALITILVISYLGLGPLSSRHQNRPEPLSNAELQQIRERLPCLKPGITVKQALELLGSNIEARNVGLNGSGPTDDYRYVYQMAEASNENGYNLIIVTDELRRFKRAEIACWIDHPQCLDANQRAKENPKKCPSHTSAPDDSGTGEGGSAAAKR